MNTKDKWTRRVPNKPGLYWTAVIYDGVQNMTLRRIRKMSGRAIPPSKSGLWLSPGIMCGMEPLEIVIDDGKRIKRYWLPATVPMMKGAVEVDA